MKERKFTIGRDRSCDLIVTDDGKTVSRKHAELTITPRGRLFLIDCNSTNGTYLLQNGEARPIQQEYVAPGDTIQLGERVTPVKELLEDIQLKFPGPGGASSSDAEIAESSPSSAKAQGEILIRTTEGKVVPLDEYRNND